MEHNKTSNPAGQWLDRATEGIQFGPDRKAVRAELDGHLDDKNSGFTAHLPGPVRMGGHPDGPVRHGRPGGRSGGSWPSSTSPGWGTCGGPARSPWALCWLWGSASLAGGSGPQVTAPNVGGTQDSWAVEIPFSGGTVQAGQYTIQAEGDSVPLGAGGRPGDPGGDLAGVEPPFWESPSYNEYWWAEDDQGNVYISRAEGRMSNVLRGLVVDQNGYNRYREVYGPSWRRSGLGWWDDGRVSSVPRGRPVGPPGAGHRGGAHHHFAGAGGGMDRETRKTGPPGADFSGTSCWPGCWAR